MKSTTSHLNWGDSRKKIARNETIISQYQSHFGKTLPKNKQYWTLCSTCSDDKGNLVKGCELYHAVHSGLITPNQFHGVEHNPDIHKLNIQIQTDAHFYNNDFYSEMLKAYQSHTFNPGVINVDTLFMPHRGTLMLARVMFLISETPNINNVLVVGNFILKNPYNGVMVSPNEITQELQTEPAFKFAMVKQPWQFDNRAYIYNGTGDLHRCLMGSVVFWLKK